MHSRSSTALNEQPGTHKPYFIIAFSKALADGLVGLMTMMLMAVIVSRRATRHSRLSSYEHASDGQDGLDDWRHSPGHPPAARRLKRDSARARHHLEGRTRAIIGREPLMPRDPVAMPPPRGPVLVGLRRVLEGLAGLAHEV